MSIQSWVWEGKCGKKGAKGGKYGIEQKKNSPSDKFVSAAICILSVLLASGALNTF